MNRIPFVVGVLFLLTQGCAIGELESAAKALEKAEKQIDELDIAECMSSCSDGASACFDRANGTCIDACEISFSLCEDQEESCKDDAHDSCRHLDSSDYYDCMDSFDEECDFDCDGAMSDCGQECGDQLAECFFEDMQTHNTDPAYSQCVTSCVDEMERTLKDIDL